MKYSIIKKNITPKGPVHFSGFNKSKKSIGVLDPIEINSLAFEVDNKLFIYSYLDSIIVTKEFVEDIKTKLKPQLKGFDYVLNIGAIHTHSAPAFFNLTFDDVFIEEDLQKNASKKMVESIIEAVESLKLCTIHFKKCNIDGLYGNRNTENGLSDKSVNILEFRENGITKGTFLNITVHPTVLGRDNLKLSSDLIGRIRALYEESTNAPCIVTNGAAGDVSTRFYRGKNNEETLTNTSNEIIKQILDKSVEIPLNLSFIETGNVHYISSSDFKRDEYTIKMMKTSDDQSSFFRKRCEDRLKMGKFEMNLESNIVHLNDLLLITLPGDVVSHFGLEIKNRLSQFHVILIGYTNTYSNYLVNKEQYGLYFETFSSRLMKGEADKFIELIINKCLSL